ncbi:hypothetical protein [Nitrosomonas sp.]|uniref:hypothetical protein n=1 Tax=Nitrosomonas sp. TaxID=42353 RepID=UPI0025D1536F|nr:hypothetical protein [Nitrosomonas sp.]
MANLAADVFTAHQAIGEVALFKSRVVSSGSTDKHSLLLQKKQEEKLCGQKYYGTTKLFPAGLKTIHNNNKFVKNATKQKYSKNWPCDVKDG